MPRPNPFNATMRSVLGTFVHTTPEDEM